MLKRAATALAIWNTVACAQEQEPCKAPHPLVPQSHPAPRTPNIAIVALVYDGSSITPQDLEARFSGPAVDYIKRVSQGCTKITYVPFVANIPASENGTPCYTQSDQYESVPVPAIPGYSPEEFYATIVTVLREGCSTSAVTGSMSLQIDGTRTSLGKALFMSLHQGDPNPVNRLGEVTGLKSGQWVLIHELLHLFGAGYHSNALKCVNPATDQNDVLKCPSDEYGDFFDMLGSSSSRASNVNARLRYMFGWLGKDDITVVAGRGQHHLSPVNEANSMTQLASPEHPFAAVLPKSGLWLEWRNGMDSAAEGKALDSNPGFWVRYHQNLIDADVQNCSSFEWSDPVFGDPHPERFAVTLKEGKTLIFNNQGILLQHDPVQDEAVRSFSAHFTGAAPPCNRASPDIATGIRGEWSVCESAQTNDGKCDFDANEGMQKLAGFSRKSKHTVNGISNRDTIGCGDVWQGFAIEAASDLPAGWVFAPMLLSGDRDGGPGCEGAGFCSRANFDFLGGGFAYGIPDNAPDGDYDLCITATNTVSGHRAAKIHRVTLPEVGQQSWFNNRPAQYANVDPALASFCRALDGSCAPGYPKCTVPSNDNCRLDQVCEGTMSTDWGYCWLDEYGQGKRSRGKNFEAVKQSFCQGGGRLLETESCSGGLKTACTDQSNCQIGTTEWTELLTVGLDPAPSMCWPAWGGMCPSNRPNSNDPICADHQGGADLQYEFQGENKCYFPLPAFPDEGWDAPPVVDVACIRALCESSVNCGGYSLKKDNSSISFFGTDIMAPQAKNDANPMSCWMKPQPPEQSCTCLGGPVIKSEGCSEYPLYMPEQWQGPVCDGTNAVNPSPAPTRVPKLSAAAKEGPWRNFGPLPTALAAVAMFAGL